MASVGDLVSRMYKLKTMITNTHELSNKHSTPNCAKPLLADSGYIYY